MDVSGATDLACPGSRAVKRVYCCCHCIGMHFRSTCNPIPERQTILDSAAAGDDEGGVAANRKS